MNRLYRALGLMSGTSLDGIDVALIETDGQEQARSLAGATYPYDEAFRAQMQACFGNRRGRQAPNVAAAEAVSTRLHTEAVRRFLQEKGIAAESVDLIGYHGQTVWHDPARGETIQLGDGAALARATGIDTVDDFRSADVAAGGQGAPLLPLYHRALARDLPKPVAILNIGGVANLTWIGGERDDEILAFDTGPGNALLNDWMQSQAGEPFDRDGAIAAKGHVDGELVTAFLAHPYFLKRPPKSLDRDAFGRFMPTGASLEDGAATLTMMTVQAVAHGLRQTGQAPRTIYVCGGGAHNGTMRAWLAQATGAQVGSVSDLGWNNDGLEAEGFAYLAVRSVLGLPLSLPGTTGAPRPILGGRLNRKG